MRIAHVVCVYPPYRGGIGKTAEEYVNGLRAQGHDVHVFTPSNTWGLRFGNAAVMPSLLWRLKGFDVIHLHYPFYGSAFFTAVAATLFRIPLVVTYHMKTKGTGFLGYFFWLHRVLVEPLILGDASMIFVSSLDYAHAVPLDWHNMHALPFSVDAERFSPGSDHVLRADLGIALESIVFLFVGGMDDAHYFKGLSVLIDAVARLPKDERWDVVLVGSGNQQSTFEAQAEQLGLTDRVHFAGRVDDVNLPRYYRMADVHVLPSIDRSEAFGLVTLEAAASGIPSLVSDLPGVRTLVIPEETGRRVRAGDVAAWTQAMQDMINDRSRCEAWGRHARTMAVDHYDPEKLLDQLISFYKQVTVEETFLTEDHVV